MKKISLILGFLVLGLNFAFGQQMSEPFNVSHSATNEKWAQVAMGPNGEVHMVWGEGTEAGQEGDDVIYVKYDGKEWRAPLRLKKTVGIPAERPYIYCNAKGVIAVVWDEDGYTTLRVYDPVQTKWLEPETISDAQGRGVNEQWVTVDLDGNIYAFWFSKSEGKVHSRSKINGVWEDVKRMSSPAFSTQVCVAAGDDGRIWALWREKGGDGNYKIRYTKRTASTPWSGSKIMNSAGTSQAHPGLAIGPDDIPYVVYGDQVNEGAPTTIYICKLDEITNSLEVVTGSDLLHYPRIAFDAYGNKHVAVQRGTGDNGEGIKYTNNIGGHWSPAVVMANSGGLTKLPGIASDPFGNVALVWAAGGEAWFSSLYPVVAKKLYPPINLTGSLGFAPNPTYTLNWEANPLNNIQHIKAYNIYKKEEGDADFQLLLKVSKTSTSASFSFPEVKPTIQFGITVVGVNGAESGAAIFQIDLPPVLAPVNLSAGVSLHFLGGVPDATYKLSWQANPSDAANYIQGYKIYKKEGSGDFLAIATLPNSTFSVTYSIANPQQRILFGVTAVSVLGQQSTMVVFGSAPTQTGGVRSRTALLKHRN
jgi:hypothetical protein